MFRGSIANLPRAAARAARITAPRTTSVARVAATPTGRIYTGLRFLSSTAPRQIAILPDGAKEPANEADKPTKTDNLAPTEITEAQYHQLADEYLEAILNKFEELQDSREDVDVEYSAGVMTVNFGPNVGTYVINKQPPNKQIWLSSPKSGPKRFDWVVQGEGQNDKQGTAVGDWMYIRHGTTLSKLFRDELGVDLGLPARRFGD
ncbi:Frataxin [Coniochaeta ligniaria NRRL 30616]|uniref:ferroxidase n=1 Tax=Coniochaeta ligniaria NRRL 30616 TaxID=1408157 RepID=A0A1J7JEW3_9PEZI|nr:Frataxin [Coniochaeta ligniaria NRRL 30616]